MKHASWVFANWWAYVFGWSFLSPFHRAFAALSLHALGYDNMRHSGEAWFIKNVVVPLNPKICIDVGANIGNYTALLRAAMPNTVIHAVEPSSTAYALLQKRFNGDGKIHTYQLAITDKNGTAALYSKTPASEKASLVQSSGTQTEIVNTQPFAEFAQSVGIDAVDFLKVDTEGFEREVLSNLGSRPRLIQFEFNIDHLQRDTTLKSLTDQLPGYRFYRLLPHGMIPLRPETYLDNVFMFCNIIAERHSAATSSATT